MKHAASPWAGVFSLLRQRPAACLGFAERAVLPLLTKLPRTARYWRAQVLNANGSKLIGPRSHGITNRLRWHEPRSQTSLFPLRRSFCRDWSASSCNRDRVRPNCDRKRGTLTRDRALDRLDLATCHN